MFPLTPPSPARGEGEKCYFQASYGDTEDQIPPALPLQKVPPFAGFGKEGLGEISTAMHPLNDGLISSSSIR